jgi:hypothetical protein
MRLMALMAQPRDFTWLPLRGVRATLIALMALMAQPRDFTWIGTTRYRRFRSSPPPAVAFP